MALWRPIFLGGLAGLGAAADYHWPTAHGSPKHYGRSPYPGPFNLSTSLAWSWQVPDNKYADMPLGATIDDKGNIFVSSDGGLWKLSPEGKTLWAFLPPMPDGWLSVSRRPPLYNPNGASLYEGKVYLNTADGRFFAVDMETGEEIWSNKIAKDACFDTGHVVVHAGVVIAETDSTSPRVDLCKTIRGVNATDGSELWNFQPDDNLWDLMVQFPDDETFVFQDISGRAYRNHLSNGTNIWKKGGQPGGSWTDGTQGLGENGLVYTVAITNTEPQCYGLRKAGGPDCPGTLTAFRLSDGHQLWQQKVTRPPNSSPVVGRLGGPGSPLSVVIPVGQQPSCDSAATTLWHWFPSMLTLSPSLQSGIFVFFHWLSMWLGDRQQQLWGNADLPTDIFAFDADTGAPRWKWKGPTYKRIQCPADAAGRFTRELMGHRHASCPTPWSAPRIGADGTIYVGNQNGFFYAIRDLNGDGQIDDKTEVSSFDCEAEFTSVGSAHAPGMVVIASTVKVWAFKA